MTKKILCVIVLMLALVCAFTSCNSNTPSTPTHTHAYGDWETTKKASCTADGTKERYCECGSIDVQPISSTEHNYLENICINCGIHFHETDVYRYNQLKPYADKIALYWAKYQIESSIDESCTIEYRTLPHNLSTNKDYSPYSSAEFAFLPNSN